MENSAQKNADRFMGFAHIYEAARPKMPLYPIQIIQTYLGHEPQMVADLGCGTGLSTLIWDGHCERAIGVEPSPDMLAVANQKSNSTLTFRRGFAHDTGLPDEQFDAVVCSQSFHWMEPVSTLAEVNRLLKRGGIFATVDCDWPPVVNWRLDKAYTDLFTRVHELEDTHPIVKSNFIRYAKNKHLTNMQSSGCFRYTREIVFSNREACSPQRLKDLVMSQGSLQGILKTVPELIRAETDTYLGLIDSLLTEDTFEIDFSYRMRIGVK